MICAYSTGGPEGRHEIPDDQVHISATIDIDWGAEDARSQAEKTLVFCSFDHLAQYAAGRAVAHDGRTVVKAEAVE